ncbi:four-helix bundle copper-binding protein [Robertkochia aurantiaca]|uniref:four-helix bundle copper-binding protein n=1 Tax=Robertkochia aurantiaca TaxID=2873700 RepID=UPI001CCD919B|nr:four-helix bundle copper-binding protein [Robertkochia sp. 3YJGBD-33]
MKNKEFLIALSDCAKACNHCADACLDEKEIDKMVSCIRQDRICAEVCQALHNILLVSAANADRLVEYCREVCKSCADECDQHENDHCKDCARACRTCVKACDAFLNS